MKSVVLTALLLVACQKTTEEVAEDMYPGLKCFHGKRDEFALCVNNRARFVCFASTSSNTAFCLRAVSESELTNVEKDEYNTGR